MKHIRFSKLVALVLLVTMLALTFASCSFTMGPANSGSTNIDPNPVELRDPYSDLDSRKFKIGDMSLVNQYNKADEEAVRQTLAELKALLEEGKRQRKFIDTYILFEEQYEYLLYSLSLANIEFYLIQKSEEAETNYLYLTSLQTEIVKEAIQMYRPIYDSPFRAAFFEGWTEEEIKEALVSSDQYTDEFAEMRNLDEQYLVEYRELIDKNDLDAIAELYIDFAKNKNAMAVQLGYDNYMDYAYDAIYTRDYEVEDVAAAMTNIKKVTPYLMDSYMSYYRNATTASAQDVADYEGFTSKRVITNDINKQFLRDFYTQLNAQAVELFDGVWSGGHYFIASDARQSYQGAFTTSIYMIDRPIMYFGPGCHDMFTFTHEFGHYMAEFMSTAENLNYDLAEIQSQGGEMLFLRYLQSGEFCSKKAADIIAHFSIVNTILTICLATSVNAFETYVYENIDTIEAADLQGIFDRCLDDIAGLDNLDSLGVAASDYWALVCIENPGYYISYAMSALPSLALYSMSADDYQGAADLYFKLLSADTDGFCSELEEVGMYTPFDPELYTIIIEAFEEEFN